MDFFTSGRILKEINNTILVLVLKVPNATTLDDFRPIVCYNTIYKIITKLLANRVASVLKDLVSSCQSAFVKGRRIRDNILLAQELFSNFHLEPYSPKCAVKVDFRKAYDTVDWRFLESVLLTFRFPDCLVQFIKTCVLTPRFSIALRELHGFFPSRHGLRQGDPISPYLFTLVMEVLSGILRRCSLQPDFSFLWRCRSTSLSHLFFADDVFLFCKGHVPSVTLLKEEGSLPVRYLGVPIITSRLRKIDCVVLVRHITSRVKSWTHRFLSFAGHLQLIRQFLWRGPELGRGGAKVSWDDVCLPEAEGGLGIRRLHECNKAAMLKYIWILFSDNESLWCKWIHSTFLKRKNSWVTTKLTSCSWAWKKILQIRTEFRLSFFWMIGVGLSVSLQFDNWHPRGPLNLYFSDPLIYSSGLSRQALVADLFSEDGQVVKTVLESWGLPLPFLSGDQDCFC
ncbi:uncharacterized protein LOC120293559 [Eucalyptus grandis]|uniref:uncharacterized protein LOC120293559 n=1 Tax=Eucalyptus grandis TaxID=71139 RepID=UPI00192EF365|nr:uncharacterized protein LOC120293559 [Eucalyptus grandis]